MPVALYGLRWLTPAAFEGGTELLVWLIPAQTLAGVVRVFSAYLYIEKRTRHRALMSGFEAVTNLLLTWYLVASFGVVGAAAATFLTYALSLTGSFILARRGETLQPASLVIRRWRGE